MDLIEELQAAGKLPAGWDDNLPATIEWWAKEFGATRGFYGSWLCVGMAGRWVTFGASGGYDVDENDPRGQRSWSMYCSPGLTYLINDVGSEVCNGGTVTRGDIRFLMARARARAEAGLSLGGLINGRTEVS